MKKLLYLLPLMLCAGSIRASAQAAELQQLALDIEKLTQFKAILSDMKTGYTVIENGYGEIKNISQGNLDLHNNYLTGLLSVSPALRKYSKVLDIITCQQTLLAEYKSAYSTYKAGGRFNSDEIIYMGKVYTNLINESLDNLNQLTTVMTDGKVRMSDDERMKIIDHIDSDMHDKLSYQRAFNDRISAVDAQRAQDSKDNTNLKSIYGQ